MEYTKRYREDEEFREKEKARCRARYTKKEKTDYYVENGVEYINAKRYCEITGISRRLLYKLINDEIIQAKRNKNNNRYLFLECDAYLFRDFLPNFLVFPFFTTFEKYDFNGLRDFLIKNKGNYNYKNGVFLDEKPDKIVTQFEKM